MRNWKLWILTILILALTIVSVCLLSAEKVSQYGSVFAATGSFIAVIWFYNSLQLQSAQLEEQRKQFQMEFANIRLEGKRNALLIAKDILNNMDIKVSESLKGIGTIENLPNLFLTNILRDIKPIIESDNPNVVLENINQCTKILGPARQFLLSIKEACTIILENEGIQVASSDSQPEWFVKTYYDLIKGRPFVSKYLPTAILLSDYMIPIKLECITLASLAVIGLISPGIVKEEGIKDMTDFKKNNNGFIPKIVDRYLETI